MLALWFRNRDEHRTLQKVTTSRATFRVVLLPLYALSHFCSTTNLLVQAKLVSLQAIAMDKSSG